MLEIGKISKNNKGTLAILLLSTALLIIHHFCFFYGYFGLDDMHYAKLSNQLLQGTLDFSDHYSYRWTILSFTSLSYYFFGISDLSSALPSLMLSCGVMLLIYSQFREHPYVHLVVVLLVFAIKWNVFYSDKLMPDLYVSFFIFCAWLSYNGLQGKQSITKSVLFIAGLFLAFLSKGTVILILPLLVYYFFFDMKNKKLYKWKYSIAIGLIVLASYLVLCFFLTGDALGRFTAIEANSYYNSCSYNQMPFSETIERITTGFGALIWKELFVVFLAIALFAKGYAKFLIKEDDALKGIQYYSNSIIVLFLSMNFMTISLSSYNPTCLDARHFLFVVPIMAVCAGHLVQLLNLPLWGKSALLLLLLLCTIPTIKHARYANTLNYSETKNEISILIDENKDADNKIVSNQVMVNLVDFYSGFEWKERLYTPDDFKIENCNNNCILISNWYTEFHSSRDLNKLQEELSLQKEELEIDTVFSKNLRHISAYKILK